MVNVRGVAKLAVVTSVPPAIVTSLLTLPSRLFASIRSVPLSMVTSPVKVLLPESVSIPVPLLFSPAPR